MDSQLDRPPGGLKQVWFPLRYAEHFGAQLSCVAAGFLIPISLANLALVCLFGGIFIKSLVEADAIGIFLAGSLTLIGLMVVVVLFRQIVGYLRRHRNHDVVEADERKRSAVKWLASVGIVGLAWVSVPVFWALSLGILYDMLSGDPTLGYFHGG